jgi:vanillate/3-O-methylgallate O-demethylase
MSAENLEQMIRQADGDVVGMLRNAPMGNFAFPYRPEYTNWRDEQEAWATTAILFDQSTHMTDVYFKGPDVKRLFSETAVNNFEKFGRNKAKQFVGVNEDGLVVGDGILFGLEDDEYSLVGTGIAANWVAYRAQTGGYDVDVTFDLASVINPNPRKIFRFQIQGPNALKVVERACDGELPAIKFFNMGEFTIADVPIRALNHTMVGQPGLAHTGLEMIGPLDRGPAVWAALVEAGADFGLKQGGGLAYPTTALETGWIPFPVPAIYTGDAMKGYREHLGPDTLEANYALAGSQVLAKVEDYYVTSAGTRSRRAPNSLTRRRFGCVGISRTVRVCWPTACSKNPDRAARNTSRSPSPTMPSVRTTASWPVAPTLGDRRTPPTP